MSKIVPCLWFDRQAEEAARFYVSLLPDSRIDAVLNYAADTPGGAAGEPMLVEFTLAGQAYMALNGGPAFPFTPAISLAIHCADQAEVDRLWDALGEGGTHEQCGWLKDRWGVSWQIAPSVVLEMLRDPDPDRARRVTQAIMEMTKLDIAQLQRAYDGVAAA